MTNDSTETGPPQLVAASTTTVQLVGEDTVVRMVVPPRTRNLFKGAAEAADPRRLLLRVEDLEVDAAPGTSYNVFLQEPGSSAVEVGAYLGTVTLFGVEMLDAPGHDHAPGYRKVFDVTDIFASRPSKDNDADEISIVFVPILSGSTDTTTEARFIEEQARTIEAANVRVGRVALYVS